MEAPTELYVGTGIVLGAFVLMLVNLNREYKERQRPEDGHDRAERRELKWYGNLDCDEGERTQSQLAGRRRIRCFMNPVLLSRLALDLPRHHAGCSLQA